MTTVATTKPSLALNIVLWLAQAFLAFIFGFGGFMKATAPIDDLHAKIDWTNDLPIWLLRFIGSAEFAGAVGMILPSLTRVKPQLTVYAGYGLALVMFLAVCFHLWRGEYDRLPFNIIPLVLGLLVAWGRSKKAVISAR